MGLWRQFMRDSDADEFLAVLWSRVLKITDEAIAKGLGVTVGTVRHRTGRGLRKLSSMRVSVFMMNTDQEIPRLEQKDNSQVYVSRDVLRLRYGSIESKSR